ncbi:MAG: DNA polymerase III subunit beta [Planctomycetota bacterium]|nr:DNA polymerase III subunit beta [Planctomycetota bacterium]
MKIEINREDFLSVFQTAAAIAPSRSPKPILQNVKLIAEKNSVTILATDLEIGVRVKVGEVKIEKSGSVVLPVGRFNAVLRESTDEKLLIETNDSGSVVKGKNSQFKLQAESPEEFPEIKDFEEKDYYEIPSNFFKQMIKRTLFATDAESARFALGGVLLEVEKGKLIAVGTDGRRLAKMEGTLKKTGNPKESEGKTIVPTRSMQLIDRALPETDELIKIATTANEILIQYGNGVIYSRLVAGRFPPWRDVFPKRENGIQMDINVGPIFSVLKQAAIVTSEESRGIDLSFGKGSLVMSSTTAEVGESRVEMPIPYDGEEIVLTLDHRYFADFLKVLESERTFQMEIESGESAAICSTDDGYGYVIMPLSRDRAK